MGRAIVIVGAGPAGLAAAACLRNRGVEALLLDRSGSPGGAFRTMSGGMALASPARLNALPGLALAGPDRTTAAHFRSYLERYAEGLHVEKCSVQRVEPGFRVLTDAGEIAARAVVVATGMWSFPVLPQLPAGVPALHSSAWSGAGAAQRVLIIGRGLSAVEIAEEIAGVGGRVTLSVRRPLRLLPSRILGRDPHDFAVLLERLPAVLAPQYCRGHPTLPPIDRSFSRLRRQGAIEVRPAIARWQGPRAIFADGTSMEPDLIVAATGFRFDTPFLPPEVRRAPAGHLLARGNESVSWPGLFVIGMPCAGGLDSPFLRGISRDAGRIARKLRAGVLPA